MHDLERPYTSPDYVRDVLEIQQRLGMHIPTVSQLRFYEPPLHALEGVDDLHDAGHSAHVLIASWLIGLNEQIYQGTQANFDVLGMAATRHDLGRSHGDDTTHAERGAVIIVERPELTHGLIPVDRSLVARIIADHTKLLGDLENPSIELRLIKEGDRLARQRRDDFDRGRLQYLFSRLLIAPMYELIQRSAHLPHEKKFVGTLNHAADIGMLVR